MDLMILARIYALVAEMEALKVEVISMVESDDTYTESSFITLSEQIRGIAQELHELGR